MSSGSSSRPPAADWAIVVVPAVLAGVVAELAKLYDHLEESMYSTARQVLEVNV